MIYRKTERNFFTKITTQKNGSLQQQNLSTNYEGFTDMIKKQNKSL